MLEFVRPFQPHAVIFLIWGVWPEVFNFDQFFRSGLTIIAPARFRLLPPAKPWVPAQGFVFSSTHRWSASAICV
jgi:hypothetical protein